MTKGQPMKKIIIFGGTSEGRKLAKLCGGQGLSVIVCVATEYGEAILPEIPNGTVHTGRMDKEEMKDYLEKERPEMAVDATHPYASLVSENLESACLETGVEYCRLQRESLEKDALAADEKVIMVDSVEKAAEEAGDISGTIFLATGSKELSAFCEKMTDVSRVYARILPLPDAVQNAHALGLSGKQIICMQGPFTEEMNRAMFRQTGAEILITKESGSAGGFLEKLRAAQALSMTCIVIRRPAEKEGLSFEAVCQKAGLDFQNYGENQEEMSGKEKPAFADGLEIAVIGIGIGSREGMTGEALDVLSRAEVIFGAARMLESIGFAEKEKVCGYKSEEIKDYLSRHPFVKRVAIVFSGDIGFYSGSRRICEDFAEYSPRLICGVSSVSYFAAKLQMPWQDIKLCSRHGRNCNLAAHIRREKKVFSLFGKSAEVREIACQLQDFGMVDIIFHIGINLGYRNEKILKGFPKDFLHFEEEGLCVGIFENPGPEEIITPGLPDKNFLRGKVPMTKEEVRAVVLCKLHLAKNSVVYDIGAGTGSVAIECARLLPDGMVCAIEKKEEALTLLSENKKHFGVEQLKIIAGEAPEALENLPSPTHAFIGGSGGKLREILKLLLGKNETIRIVVTAVTMETQAEMTTVLKHLPVEDVEAVTVAVSRADAAGPYHLWQAMNPVTIFSFTGKKQPG